MQEYLLTHFRGQAVLVGSKRIKSEDRMRDLFYYELRHADDWGVPETLEPFVGSDFFGTMISKDPIHIPVFRTVMDLEDSYLELTDKEKAVMGDWNCPQCTLDEFLEMSTGNDSFAE